MLMATRFQMSLFYFQEFNRIWTRIGKSGERVQRALVIGKNITRQW